jgi:hypothetical protein
MGIARVVAEIRKAAKHKFFEGVRRSVKPMTEAHFDWRPVSTRITGVLSVNEHQVQYKTCVGTC